MKRYLCVMTIGFVVLAAPAFAGVRDDVLAAMQRCSVIQDDRTWLDCAYGAQQPMRAKLGLSPAPEFQQRLVPPSAAFASAPAAVDVAPAPRHKEGLFSGPAPALGTSILVGVRYDKQGGFIATLENGQTWHQVNLLEGSPRVRLTLGAKVSILHGSMWSYDLKVDKHTYKVDREA